MKSQLKKKKRWIGSKGAKALKLWRKSSSYTMEELADEIGITRQAVSFWEDGTNVPHAAHMSFLNKKAGIDFMDWFIK